MKKITFIILFAFVALSLSAQKEVRKAVRAGNKAYNEQLYATAEAEYNKAIKENASSKEASYNLANTYYKQQKWDEALKEYQHYLTLENENPMNMSSAWSNMGNTFLKKKANEKSERAAAQMVMPQGQGQPGQAAPQQGQQQADYLKMSMEAYKNALRLNPTDDDTRYNLAVVQKMLKDREDQDQDKNQDKQDQKDDKQDQKQDPKEDPKKDPNKDPKQDQQDKQEQQMSQDNIQQILQAIEQDEKETQERVKQAKAQERKKQQDQNRKQNKDW